MRQIWRRFLLRRSLFFLVGVFVLTLMPVLASTGDATATHSWGNYHWATIATPFALEVEDDTTTVEWAALLNAISGPDGDWNKSTVLQNELTNYRSPSKRCPAIDGKVAACDDKYGLNGWLGIAQIWVSGDHIVKGVAKMNDSYFNTPTYNTPAWKQMVMCQEIGHTFGLDHQDEVFDNDNLGTCMDYTDDPDGSKKSQLSNVHPNAHDYDQLVTIYNHNDEFNSWTDGAPASGGGKGRKGIGAGLDDDEDLGRPARHTAGETLYVKDLGGGNKKLTWVFWADPGNRNLR